MNPKTKLALDTIGLHPSNVIHVVAGVVVWIYIVVPVFEFGKEAIFGTQEVVSQNTNDIYEIKEQNSKILAENERLRKENMRLRKSGEVGYSTFGANYVR